MSKCYCLCDESIKEAMPEIKRLMREGWSASYACSKVGINYGTRRFKLMRVDNEFAEMVEEKRLKCLKEGTQHKLYKKVEINEKTK